MLIETSAEDIKVLNKLHACRLNGHGMPGKMLEHLIMQRHNTVDTFSIVGRAQWL